MSFESEGRPWLSRPKWKTTMASLLLDPKCFKGVCQKYTLQPVILRVFADQTTPSCAANTKEMAFNNEATITFFLILGMTFRGLVHESEQQCFEITASQEFPCGKVDTDVMDYFEA